MKSHGKKTNREDAVGILDGIFISGIYQHIKGKLQSKLSIIFIAPERVSIYSDGTRQVVFENNIGSTIGKVFPKSIIVAEFPLYLNLHTKPPTFFPAFGHYAVKAARQTITSKKIFVRGNVIKYIDRLVATTNKSWLSRAIM